MKKKLKNKPVDQKTYLTSLLEQFTKLQAGSRSRVEKYKDLMQRKSAKDWDEGKRKKAESRLAQAELEYSQSFDIIDQIRNKLGQLNES